MPDVDCFFDFNEAATFLDAIAPSAPTPTSTHSGHTLSPESTHSHTALPFQEAGWSPYANPYEVESTVNPAFSVPDNTGPQSHPGIYDGPSSASNSLHALYHSNSSVPTSPDLVTKNMVKQEYDMNQELDMHFDDYAGLEDLSRHHSHNSSTASARAGRVSKPRGKDKTNHNLIEKKYRTNINAKILMLRDAVPTLRFAAGASRESSVAALEGLSPASKLNKASIFTKATEYIQHLEQKVEYLSAKNQELQSMLNAATAATSSHHNTPMLAMTLHTTLPYPVLNQPRNQPQFVDLSYSAPDGSYGHTPMQQSYSGNSVLSANIHGETHGQDFRGSKLLMGGMAAVMTTSLFGGHNQNDVRGLSALPFANLLPRALTLNAPVLSHFLGVLKACLVLAAFYAVFEPYVTAWFLPKLQKSIPRIGSTSAFAISKTWLSATLRLHVPHPLSPEMRASILARLNGDVLPSSSPIKTLLLDYMVLVGSADSFETAFLTLVVGKLLLVECPALAVFLNHGMSIKGRLLLNLEYKGDNKSLAAIKRLIADVDDLAWLASPSLAQRLHNLATGRPSNHNVTDDCREHQRYLQIRQQSRDDYYRTWRDWRVLEVAASLNAIGLESADKLPECVADLNKLSMAIDGHCLVKLYVELVAALANPSAADVAVQAIQARIKRQLLNYKLVTEGPDLTDGEISTDEESLDAKFLADATLSASDGPEESDTDVAATMIDQVAFPGKVPSINKSLVSSLNLVSVEEYLVCASTLILQFNQQGKTVEARRLLATLQLSCDTPILFLGFTSLVRLVNGLAPETETSPVLETCAVSAMTFLRNPITCDCISSAGRATLSKMLLAKCKSFNGIDELA